jgi:hypothetical protein
MAFPKKEENKESEAFVTHGHPKLFLDTLI